MKNAFFLVLLLSLAAAWAEDICIQGHPGFTNCLKDKLNTGIITTEEFSAIQALSQASQKEYIDASGRHWANRDEASQAASIERASQSQAQAAPRDHPFVRAVAQGLFMGTRQYANGLQQQGARQQHCTTQFNGSQAYTDCY